MLDDLHALAEFVQAGSMSASASSQCQYVLGDTPADATM